MPTYRVTVDGQTYTVEVTDPTTRPVRTVVDGEVIMVEVAGGAPAANPAPVAAPDVAPVPQPVALVSTAAPRPVASAPVASSGGGTVTAPLPGTVVSISVSEGDVVARGQELVVLEAMKMNNPIRATTPGTVASIAVNIGQQVQHGEILLTLE